MLRIILALMVVFVHTDRLTGTYVCMHGFLAVDAFFMLSGYLMMQHAQRVDSLDTFPFLWRRIRSFLPEAFLALCIGCIVTYGATGCSLKEFAYTLFQSILKDIFLLKMTGFVPLRCDVNGVTWYLSSLMIGMAILYPYVRNRRLPILLPILSVLSLAYILHDVGSFAKAYEWMGFTYMGNIRALAELVLGAFAYTMTPKFAVLGESKHMRYATLPLMYGALAFALLIACRGGDLYNQAYFIMAVWLFLTFSFAQVGFRLHHPVCLFLGRLSLPLYLGHVFWARNLPGILPVNISHTSSLGVYFILSLITALLLMGLSAKLRSAMENTAWRHLTRQESMNSITPDGYGKHS